MLQIDDQPTQTASGCATIIAPVLYSLVDVQHPTSTTVTGRREDGTARRCSHILVSAVL